MTSTPKRNWLGTVEILGSVAFMLLAAAVRAEMPVDDVNPFVGTDLSEHTFPGATVPFGLVQVSPDTRVDGWDACSGYHYTDNSLYGFSFTHLSGTGARDLGNLLLIPTVGDLKMEPGKVAGEGYRTRFSHDQETARPGYYSVMLPDYRVKVELTATCRVGVQQYTFLDATNAHVILDLWHGLGNVPSDATLAIENDHTVSGYRASNPIGFGGYKAYYFVAEFSRPFARAGIVLDGKEIDAKETSGRNLKAHFDYQTKGGEKLMVRMGISTVSVEGARKNLRAEATTWDFDKVAATARKEWSTALDRLRIETTNDRVRQTFYTAMYHTLVAPIVFNDVDGQYRGPDCQVHQAKGFNFYTDLSVWDTYRAEQGLLTLTQPGRVNDIVETMLTQYKLLAEQMFPCCAFGGKETYSMYGNPSIPVIAEAYAKGFRGWDANEALSDMEGATERNDDKLMEFIIHTNTYEDYRAHGGEASPERFNHRHDFVGFTNYRRYGWVPSDDSGVYVQSVSKTLEFAYEDACVARFARLLGRDDLGEIYASRSTNWENVFDASTGFMRGRYANRDWVTPFNPYKVTFHEDYAEANAWQVSFLVPQNVPGLIQALGGDEKFVAKLDEMFDTPTSKIPRPFDPDVSGLIGLYCVGNEPDENFPYLYNYAGAPWKTQLRVRQTCALYDQTPAGLPGNDDCGQISAWYVFSALGFYPVDPPSGVYVMGSPLVDKATITLDPKYYKGGSFTVIAKNNSAENQYIQAARLNGRPLRRSWITYDEIGAGGTLELVMGPQPNRDWGAAPADRPAQPVLP
ncbi:MAG: GH92 family glycosyl hydrolase [Verrucomicrobiota bacterium]|jgi:predicted alpha-1,2-mannosidase